MSFDIYKLAIIAIELKQAYESKPNSATYPVKDYLPEASTLLLEAEKELEAFERKKLSEIQSTLDEID